MLKLICCALIAIIFNVEVMAKELRYPNIHGIGESTLGFSILKLALSEVENDYHLTVSPLKVTPNRAKFMLESGQLDVFDSGFIPELEESLEPIYLPLEMGLLGWRIFIVHKDMLEKLRLINTLDELKDFVVGQGIGWGDITILEHAGFKVLTATKMENLIKMVEHKRFDLLPLGANEAYRFLELFGEQSDQLTVDNTIALVYPYGRFFYVQKNNTELKQVIETGMMRALEDGSLLALLKSHPFSRDAFERANLGGRVQIRIDTPNLTQGFKAIDQKWWYAP
ncbi:hypothetical protein DI392_11300 [Vibrio albus]|uniref:Amino acid ABC transporter substrate-binding protein n=1 Tax=Vibrio albus TaxID=2200953 RepID=A0A2U3B9N2_9VIBR|nr:hypothetical protein [Vibrio albus]PWI33424.1 hypothetical protein DI392_11300 [Vibrio albus]